MRAPDFCRRIRYRQRARIGKGVPYVKHVAFIHYGEDEMAVGLGETESEAAANAVEAYCGGPEPWSRLSDRLRPAIAIHDLVDGMRLNRHQDTPYRVYEGPIGETAAPGPR
jgi:hypothetical protein